MQTLFLDFDGVLFDTLREAFVLCRYVCDGTDLFNPIEQDIYEMFYKYKFLVYHSWQYLYLWQAIKSDNIQQNYNTLLTQRDLQAEDKFETEYLKARKDLINNYPEYVDKLEEKFPFLDMVKTLENKYNILILSRKNTFAIERKNTGFKIIGKEELSGVENKSDFIAEYMKKNHVEKAYFIDDNSHNLTPCKNIPNLTCILAGWGNCGINERGYSQEEAFNFILSEP